MRGAIMVLIAMVVWIVLMMFWLFFGSYTTWDPVKPYVVGNTLVPWFCVLIVGVLLFYSLSAGSSTIGPLGR